MKSINLRHIIDWSQQKIVYEELTENKRAKWNTTNIRKAITDLLPNNIRFIYYQDQYCLINIDKTVEILHFFNERYIVNTQKKVISTQIEKSNNSSPITSSSGQHKCLKGFSVNNDALRYCTSNQGKHLVLYSGIVAERITTENLYRSLQYEIDFSGNKIRCSSCSRFHKLINQRGSRSQKSVDKGMIISRDVRYTNTEGLMLAQINALKSALDESKRSVKKLELVVDSYFQVNVHLSNDEPDVLVLKKELFFLMCRALEKAEGFNFTFELFSNYLENFLLESPFARSYGSVQILY